MSRKRNLTAGLALMILAAACAGDTSGEATESVAPTGESGATLVRPGRANWSTGYFQAAVYSALLERLGYTVADPALNEYPPAEGYFAMAQGTFDFWANGWYSQHETWHDRELDVGTVVGDHLVVLGEQIPSGALEGLVITKSIADEYGIESLDQINNDPALARLFDVDGDGLGEVFGCEEDWTCDDVIAEMIEFNGWSNLEQIQAGYPGLVAASIDRVEKGLPVIQYTWSPSGYLTQLVPGENVLWLSVGSRDNVLDGSTPGGFNFAHADSAQLGNDCSADPCWIGWEAADIRVTANKSFAEANPVAVALFEVVELNVADIVAQIVRYDNGENTEADISRHAEEWIAENRPLVDQWLESAAAAAGGG
jgi:glycine betaine/proline transport system substrate-binding protein